MNSFSGTTSEDEMTVHQYVGKWESVTPFAANQSVAASDKAAPGGTGMVMLQVRRNYSIFILRPEGRGVNTLFLVFIYVIELQELNK